MLGLETLAWERLPDLTHARSGHACCVVRGGTLVALGGYGGALPVEVLERGAEAWRRCHRSHATGANTFVSLRGGERERRGPSAHPRRH